MISGRVHRMAGRSSTALGFVLAIACGQQGEYMTADEPLLPCEGLSCDDGNPCTVDRCEAGRCASVAAAEGSSCGSGNECVSGRCVAAAASCQSAADCQDGDACNGTEACGANGRCAAGSSLVCDDGNPCSVDSCEPATGCESEPAAESLACGAGRACRAGQCVSIEPDCTRDLDCTDGNLCTGAERCVEGRCIRGTPPQCSDGVACNGLESCNPASGCMPGAAQPCDDGNPCTTDSCGAQGCQVVALADGQSCGERRICQAGVCETVGCTTDTHCGDNNACNGNETCSAAHTCVPGTPPSCNDNNACNGVESCDPANGCRPGTAPTCNDNNPCTTDACDPLEECLTTNVPDETACGSTAVCRRGGCLSAGSCTLDVDCDDHNLCTGTETCGPDQRCQPGTPLSCGDGLACNGTETCDPIAGCRPGTALNCDDSNVCTTDSCAEPLGCARTPVENLTSCGEGMRCVVSVTAAECIQAQCTTALDCDDRNVCNGVEQCSPRLQCVPGTPSPQDEGRSCGTDGVRCESGSCVRDVQATFVDVGYFRQSITLETGAPYRSQRFASPDNEHQSYNTGFQFDNRYQYETRSYFVFRIPDGARVQRARLRLFGSQPHRFNANTGAFVSDDPSETLVLHSAATAPVTLLALPFNQLGGNDADDLVFADLGDGTVLGQRVYTVADEQPPGLVPLPFAATGTDCSTGDPQLPCGRFIDIPLNPAAVAEISAAAGLQWLVGARLGTVTLSAPVTTTPDQIVNAGGGIDINLAIKPHLSQFRTPPPELVLSVLHP
jgi:hypothetical protein